MINGAIRKITGLRGLPDQGKPKVQLNPNPDQIIKEKEKVK